MKLIVWDFDDTLVDTKPLIEACMNHVLQKLDLDYKLKHIWLKYASLPIQESIYYTFNKLGVSSDLIIKTYKNFDYKKYRHLIREFDGMSKLLNELKMLGFHMSIASAKDRETLMFQIDMLKWQHLFYPIVSSDDVELRKPHPESIYRCLNMLNINNKDAIMIGDTQFDIDMAKNANIYNISVGYGLKNTVVPTKVNLMSYVTNLTELRKEILKWSQT